MELTPGYKQTEVGVIPEDWEVQPFLKAAHIANGQVDPKVEPYRSMILVAPDHIESSTGRLLSKETAEEQHAISGKYFFDSGDIVYSKIRPYLRKAILADFAGLCSADMYPLKPASDVSPEFLLAIVLGHRFSKYAESVSVRSGMPKINRKELADFSVALPPHPEQVEIGKVLRDVDALLEGLERLIAKKRDLKQSVMQQLLTGKTRLPGFTAEWGVKKLGDIAHIKTGSRNNEDKVEDGQYPFFVRSDVVERINSYSYDCEAILVPGEGRIGSIFHYVDGRFDLHQRVYAITDFDADISARFIHYYMSRNFGAWAMQNTVKATVDSLRLPTFLDFKMMIPSSLAEQTAIAAVLTDMNAELESLENRLVKTQDLKQAMMQELLTGKTRLVISEAIHA
jgi:type I restriction enzyme S subunit